MRVLITSEWYKPVINGVVTSVVNLQNELEREGHEVMILTLAQGKKSYREGNVIYVASNGAEELYPNARFRISMPYSWIDQVLAWKPDIIHSQCEFSTFRFARKVSKLLHIPIVHTYHTVYEDYTHYFSPTIKTGKKLARWMTRIISRRVDAIVAPTQKTKNILMSYDISTPISVIPSGLVMKEPMEDENINREAFEIAKDACVLLYLGRLAAEKNVAEILSNLADYQGEPITFLIVGDGPERQKLEKKAKEVGDNVRVIFAGMAAPQQVASYYRMANLFVSASNSETQGLTYIEAAASGLPLLCKRDDCLEDVISENGWQYEDKADFLSRLHEFLEMGFIERNAMGVRSIEVAKQFDIERITQKMVALYKRTLQKAKREETLWGQNRRQMEGLEES